MYGDDDVGYMRDRGFAHWPSKSFVQSSELRSPPLIRPHSPHAHAHGAFGVLLSKSSLGKTLIRSREVRKKILKKIVEID